MASADDFDLFAAPDPGACDLSGRTDSARGAGRRSFLRMASHELRTPLNAVIGFSEIISRELHGPIGDPRYAQHARLIRESGLKLLDLVNQIMDIARLEAGAMDVLLRPEPLDEIAGEAIAAVQGVADERRVRLVRALEADARVVVCDRRGLQTVLAALLANAVAASPEGGVVSVTARRDGGRVRVHVRDEGPGFDPAELGRLMRPFEQGENALVRTTDGAGLGLPLSKLFCEAMNGRLRLSTTPGSGVVATVELPAPAASAPTAVSPSA